MSKIWKTASHNKFGRLFFVLIIIAVVFSYLIARPGQNDYVYAGAITSPLITPATVAAGATYTPTITFTTATTIPAGGTISLSFFSLGEAGSLNFTVNGASLTASTPAGLTLVQASGGMVTLLAGSALTPQVFSITLGGIVAPAGCTVQTVNVTTRNNQGTLIDGDNGAEGRLPTSITNPIIVGSPAFQGTLTKSDGLTGVSGAYISLNDSNYRYITGSQTYGNGAYAICGSSLVTNGSYSMMVFMDGSVANSYPDQVPPDPVTINYAGSTVTRNISLAAATKTLTGTVRFSDGAAVTGGTIDIFGTDSPSWRQVIIGTNGGYTARLAGGNYGLNPSGSNATPPWSYSGEFQQVNFKKDQSTESQTVDFAVSRANARISITVLDPQGNKVDGRNLRGSIGLMPGSFKGGGAGVNLQINENGKAESNVATGIYNVEAWLDPTASNWYIPKTRVTLTENTTTSLTVQFRNKTGRIVGKVTDNDSGAGIANVFVGAFSDEAGSFAGAQTGGDGNFSLAVIEGYEWGVMAMPEGGFGKSSELSQSYVQLGGPKFVTVSAGKPAPTANLKMKKADSSALISAIGEDGKVVPNFYGYVNFNNDDDSKGEEMFSGLGGPIDRGRGTVSLPSGSYKEVQLFAAPGSGVIPGNPLTNIAIPANTANYQVNYPVYNPDQNGQIIAKKTDGSIATNISFIGCAVNKNGVLVFGEPSQNGRSSVGIASEVGPWTACIASLDNEDDYAIQIDNPKITPTSSGSWTVDGTVRDKNAIVTGTVYGADGNPLAGAYVRASNRGSNISTTMMDKFRSSDGVLTDANGTYRLKLVAGTYNITATMPPSAGLINPAPKQITIGANSTTSVHLTFRAPNHTISGTVKNDSDKVVVNALVNAYSADGETAETETDATGVYRLRVLKDKTWNVEVNKNDGNDTLGAGPTAILTTGDSSSIDFTLTRSSNRLGNAVTKNGSASSAIAVSTTSSNVTFPASATGSSGTTTVTSTETSEVPSDRDNQVIGVAMDITASNNGSSVSQLNSNASLQISYRDSDIPTGVNESDLELAYYDETAGAWVNIGGSVDTTNNIVSDTVDHLTTFAIVASADTVAPSAPTNVSATDAKTGGRITLAWTNPNDSDFNHVDIYQSTASGATGSRVASTQNASTQSLIISGLTDGVSYYFTLKAVDNAANSSVASSQVSAAPTSGGAPLPKTGYEGNIFPNFVTAILGLFLIGILRLIFAYHAKRI